MARTGRESFEKRQRAKARQERNETKRARREERRTTESEEPEVDEAALMAEYGRLAERYEAGEVDDETFAARKLELFTALDLDVP